MMMEITFSKRMCDVCFRFRVCLIQKIWEHVNQKFMLKCTEWPIHNKNNIPYKFRLLLM